MPNAIASSERLKQTLIRQGWKQRDFTRQMIMTVGGYRRGPAPLRVMRGGAVEVVNVRFSKTEAIHIRIAAVAVLARHPPASCGIVDTHGKRWSLSCTKRTISLFRDDREFVLSPTQAAAALLSVAHKSTPRRSTMAIAEAIRHKMNQLSATSPERQKAFHASVAVLCGPKR